MSNPKLDDELLTDFASGFFGYGNLSAPIWFIGMEEGGGNTAAEVAARLDAWVAHDRAPVVDVVSYSTSAGLDEHAHWFTGQRPPLQSTWRQLIRVQLGRLGESCDAESVRCYQRDNFARSGGEECLLELLPLPSPSIAHWHYSEWSRLAWLQSRDAYRAQLIPARIEKLQALMEHHRPLSVVFYGLGYLDEWSRICRADFDSGGEGWRETRTGETTCVAIPHPAARGWRNDDFTRLGRWLARRV